MQVEGLAEPVKVTVGAAHVIVCEPDIDTVLEYLLPRLTEIEVYHVILEAMASEHSARMIAMRNATDNASELIDSLKMMYNRIRQANITTEISEIVGSMSAF